MPAHWCVGLGLDSVVVGRAVSRGVSRGDFGLKMSLSSLHADGCTCVPTLSVVWSEASQHWSSQAVGWGQVSVPRT